MTTARHTRRPTPSECRRLQALLDETQHDLNCIRERLRVHRLNLAALTITAREQTEALRDLAGRMDEGEEWKRGAKP